MSDGIEDYDPLRDEFDKLEREVRARKIEEQRASCPHECMREIGIIAHPALWVCASCGFPTDVRP